MRGIKAEEVTSSGPQSMPTSEAEGECRSGKVLYVEASVVVDDVVKATIPRVKVPPRPATVLASTGADFKDAELCRFYADTLEAAALARPNRAGC